MDTKFKNFQRELRKNMPLPEVILWQAIRGKQLGVKFRRQFTLGNRIIDFYSPSLKIGIEIDGETHFVSPEKRNKEVQSDKDLKSRGIKILRFINPEIRENLEGVLETIRDEVEKREKSLSRLNSSF